MKYLITESQFDRAVFLYLDYQNFVQIKKRHIIYFVNSEDNEYAQINYNKKNGLCNIKYTLIKDVSSLFSLDESILLAIAFDSSFFSVEFFCLDK